MHPTLSFTTLLADDAPRASAISPNNNHTSNIRSFDQNQRPKPNPLSRRILNGSGIFGYPLISPPRSSSPFTPYLPSGFSKTSSRSMRPLSVVSNKAYSRSMG